MDNPQVSELLSDLIGNVSEGDDRVPYIVRYRNKDRYILSSSEDEAVAAIAESLGFEAGIVPLDLILKAERERVESLEKQ